VQHTRNLRGHDGTRLRAGLPPGDRLRGVQVCGQTIAADGALEVCPATETFLFGVAAGALSAGATGDDRIDADAFATGFVARELFLLTERPRAESGSPQLPIRVDLVADSVEGFELDGSTAADGFRDDCLGDTMVQVAHPAKLPPGEPLQDPLGGSSAFGLEIRPARRELRTDMHCLSTGEEMTRGRDGEVVRTPVHADGFRGRGTNSRFLLDANVDEKLSPASNETGGGGFLFVQRLSLVSSNRKRDLDAVPENGQRD